MSNEKKIIAQLVKIAEKQQKIINRLAQEATQPGGHEAERMSGATTDWAPTIVNEVKKLIPPGVNVREARWHQSNGGAAITLEVPKTFKGNAGGAIRDGLAGKTITTDDGKPVQMTTDKYQISVTTAIG